ncbi:MAG: hypothetical protein OEZ01_15505, partial [Candidatus Heimdallarchaeota archaeon]|nr:hypothetical protein [Candidatus Heimdallarchaeota archaeon]
MALLSFLSLKNQIAVSFIGVVVLLIYQVTLFDIKGDQISMIVNIFIIGILIFFILPSQFSLMSSIPRIERQSKGILRKEFHMKKKNKYVNNELGRIENSLDNLIEYVSSISILTQNSSSTISELSQKLIREINKTNEVMTH